MSAGVFVIGERRAPHRPQGRLVAPQARQDLFQHGRRNSDVDDPEAAASTEALQGVMARLAAEEGNCQLSGRRTAHHQARVAVQAARHVDGDDGQSSSVHLLDQAGRHAFNRPRKACAEQGVDHERAIAEQVERRRLDRPAPLAGRPGGIALERGAFAEQCCAHRPRRSLQAPRGAGVSRPAQHEHGLAAIAFDHCRGHRPAGRFHERRTRRPVGNRRGIGGGHFGAGQKGCLVVAPEVPELGRLSHGGRGIGAADRT